jgi:hypothetical protein
VPITCSAPLGQVDGHKRPRGRPVRPLLHLQPGQRIRSPVLPLDDQRNLVRLLLRQLRSGVRA